MSMLNGIGPEYDAAYSFRRLQEENLRCYAERDALRAALAKEGTT